MEWEKDSVMWNWVRVTIWPSFAAPTPTIRCQFSSSIIPPPLLLYYFPTPPTVILLPVLQFYSPTSLYSSTVLHLSTVLQFSTVLYSSSGTSIYYQFYSQWKGTSYHSLGSFALHSNQSLRSKINNYYSHYSYILPLRLCPPYSYHLPPTPSSWPLQLLSSTYFTSMSSTSTYPIPHLQFYYDYLDYHQRRAACQTSKPYSDCE